MINQLRSIENAGLWGGGCCFIQDGQSHIDKMASEQRTGRNRRNKPCKQLKERFPDRGNRKYKGSESYWPLREIVRKTVGPIGREERKRDTSGQRGSRSQIL